MDKLNLQKQPKYEIVTGSFKTYAYDYEEMQNKVKAIGFDWERAKIFCDNQGGKDRWWIDKPIGFDVIEVTEL